MTLKNLLLGSVTAAGLMTGAACAADLGVLSSVDVCDQLGITGLTISSDTNCLKVSGEVSYSFSYGVWDTADGDSDSGAFYLPAGDLSWGYEVNWHDEFHGEGAHVLDTVAKAKLNFEATADSSFGPAKAVLKLLSEDIGNGGGDVTVDEAYVSIGEGTVVMAGHKGSIFNYGDDVPLNWLGLFNSEAVNTGVLADNWSNTGTSNSIQITHDLGNGFSISGGLEQLENNGIAVGVLAYKSETVSAHISTSVADILEGSDQGYWYTHAGIAATLDSVKLVAAASTDANSNWNVLGSAELSLDMFKIAGSVEADNDDYVGAGGSLTASLEDGVTLNLGGRFGTYQGDTAYELAAGAESKLAETLTLSGQVGYVFDGGYDHEDDPEGPTSSLVYGWVKLAWAPGGGFTSSIKGTVTNFLTDEYEYVKGPGFKVETEFKKTFE